MTHSAGDSSPLVLNCLHPPYPTHLFAIRNLDPATLDVKIHGELPDQTDILFGSHPSATLALAAAIHPERCVVLRLDAAAHTVTFTYFAGAVRVPGSNAGSWQTLSSPCQRIFKQSTVFYIGKHMFHVLFPDASATEDNVAVSTMAQSAVVPPSSASLPFIAPPPPMPVHATAGIQAPAQQHQPQVLQSQPVLPVQPGVHTALAKSQPLARSSSHVTLTAGTESRDGDADESKMLSKQRFNNLMRRSGSVQHKTPAANERPLAVPQAPRAQSSQSHSSQKKRAEECSFADAPADDEEEPDENSEAYDTMDDAKSRDLAAEFSNDGPKPLDPAVLGLGPSWDEDRAEQRVEERVVEAQENMADDEREEDQDIAVSTLPPFTRTSPAVAAAPPRRASHSAAVVVAPVAPPPAEQPAQAVAVVEVAAAAAAVAAAAVVVPSNKRAASSSDRSRVVKARKTAVAPQRERRSGGTMSARDLFRSTNAIIVASAKPHSIDENDNEEGYNSKRKAISKPAEPHKPESSKASTAAPTKRPRVAFNSTIVAATPDTNQQRTMPRAPKKKAGAAAAAAAATQVSDPREVVSLMQQTTLASLRETKVLVSNARMLPTQASRRSGSRVGTVSLGRLLTQQATAVPSAGDSPSASSQRSGSKSVRRALPLDAKQHTK